MLTEPQFYTAAFLFPDYFQELKRGSKPSSQLGEASVPQLSSKKEKGFSTTLLGLFSHIKHFGFLGLLSLLP